MTQAQESPIEQKNLTRYIVVIEPQLIAFAKVQLNDHNAAALLVKESISDAMADAAQINGDVAFKTWVLCILKRKLADYHRQHRSSAPNSRGKSEKSIEMLFDHRGYWQRHSKPPEWPELSELDGDEDFWFLFDLCLNELPEKHCTIFMMREYLELTPDEIRRSLGVSLNLVNVTLHRVRLRLHQVLSAHFKERR